MSVVFSPNFNAWPLALALLVVTAQVSATSVWDKSITHPLANGRLLPGDRCHFDTTNCAGAATHLGVDLMASSGSTVVAMCDGIVKHNNTALATIWNSKVIVEHNCGGPFQKIYGYYGHVSSSLTLNSVIRSGDSIGTLKDDGANSHLHMGVSYFYGESNWGYGGSAANWIDFQSILNRSNARPFLRSPANEATTGSNVSFSWDPIPNALSYRIVISQDPNPLRNFDNLTRSCNGTPNGGSPCWTNVDTITAASFSRTMAEGKTYYWVVRSNTSDWSDIGIFSSGSAGSSTVWTSGSYQNNAVVSKNLSISGANSLNVTISGETESGYDFLYIFDSNNNQIRQLSGVFNEAFTVAGSSITAKLVTDGSITKPGVTVGITRGVGTSAPTPDLAAIDRCYAKFTGYFGGKIGTPYTCFEKYTCQATSGPRVTHLAVEKNLEYNVFYYFWDGWGNLDLENCR